ncbi:CYTH and CHAD domain-containing protein [Nitrosomonas supralitoralis]|uniref:Inorganic triphosphatase n=1 Tax=Nitrosomonas supralitoralis TaxID=2116706 RepID=A0A2P7NXL7_9PROT|nr:CYTH and CHAD domain-containing protein [Nitrosomonas supralitoralis]PSJ18199.1 inorganic triphosphatase [Nitrosomonas supralitoralis]
MEIELKLALHSRHRARLRRHPLLNKVTAKQNPLLSIYFDTAKFDLMQRGIALRLRYVNNRWIQTLKAESQSAGALTSRPEWEVTVIDGKHPDFSALPPVALDLLAGIKLKHITPVFTTEFRRITWLIDSEQAQVEVALDSGKINAGDISGSICEVEIELKSGTPEFLFDVANQLLEHVPLHIEPRSKAERGYILSGAVIPAPIRTIHPMIEKNQPAGEAWNAILHAALVQLSANVPGFLENAHDTEYLHQLRVALRRLHTGARLAESLGLAIPDWDQPLRQLMQALNTARDWDVFQQEILPEILSILETPMEDVNIDDTVSALLQDTAALARQQSQEILRKPEFTRLILDIGRSLLSTAPTNARQLETKTWAKTVLDKRWQKLRKSCHGFVKLDSSRRHKARIAAKKLRYIADAFAPIYNKRADHFIAALSTFQHELGYTNDLVIGQQLLHKLPRKTVKLGFSLGRLSGVLEFAAAQRAHLPAAIWQRLARSKLFWR